MRATRLGLEAATGVIVSATIGVITNLVTKRWSWALAIALIVFVMVAAFLSARAATARAVTPRTTPNTRIRRTARRSGRIVDSGIDADSAATVTQAASRNGTIKGSSIQAKGGRVEEKAIGGLIENSPITINHN